MARSRVHRRKSHKRRGSKRMRTRRHRNRRMRQRGGDGNLNEQCMYNPRTMQSDMCNGVLMCKNGKCVKGNEVNSINTNPSNNQIF